MRPDLQHRLRHLRRWLAADGTEQLLLIPAAVLGAVLLVHLVVGR